jgi:hypothetical protein
MGILNDWRSQPRRKRTPDEVEAMRQRATRHGYSKIKGGSVWKTWDGMLQRITNPRNKDYPNYGGRGLDIDPRWLVFENFLTDMGERAEGTSIGRQNNERGYWPDNCKWKTMEEQQNNRRSSRFVEYNGERMTVAQAARRLCISRQTMRFRLEAGWDINKAFSGKDQGRAKRSQNVENNQVY